MHGPESAGREVPEEETAELERGRRIHAGDEAALDALLQRDHPVVDLLARVLASDAGPGDSAARAWERLVTGLAAARFPELGLRAAVLDHLVDVLDEDGLLDTASRETVWSGTFLGEGDPWAGWWEEEPPVWPPDLTLAPDQVLAALRAVPPGPRLLLVLRDVAALREDQAEMVSGYTEKEQEILLESARESYVVALDMLVKEGAHACG
ncbi:hypothetical protein [Actinomadura chokoriensis]|uniref:Uncharacterized protein n=1 Tax=Actinomadura chokoriensis TaxID=454156 RepID=A0ABV4R5U2_9ACTN